MAICRLRSLLSLAKCNSQTFQLRTFSSFQVPPHQLQVLGDIIESLAGAILVDSGYNKEVVWRSIRPLLEPLVTPETFKLHPAAELHILCQRRNYTLKEDLYREEDILNCIIKVETNDGVIHQFKYRGLADRRTAKKLACKEILKSLLQQTHLKCAVVFEQL